MMEHRRELKARMKTALKESNEALNKIKVAVKEPKGETAPQRKARIKLLEELREEWKQAMAEYNEASRLLFSLYL
jgi:hypothetical protein